jgi:hypothetical protein
MNGIAPVTFLFLGRPMTVKPAPLGRPLFNILGGIVIGVRVSFLVFYKNKSKTEYGILISYSIHDKITAI